VTTRKTSVVTEIELEIHDHINKHTAFSSRFPAITEIVSEWDSIFLFTRRLPKKTASVIELKEYDIDAKLQLLNNTKNYEEAFKLVQTNYNKQLERTVKLYADDLFRSDSDSDSNNFNLPSQSNTDPRQKIKQTKGRASLKMRSTAMP